MPLPQTLPLITDFKKEYKFLWNIGADLSANEAIKSLARIGVEGAEYFLAVVKNPLYAGYISQLADQVVIPDDEFEVEGIDQGPVTYQMPKKVKLNDIMVTYLDDSNESVYNFHKAWFQAIRCGKGYGINSPFLFSAKAQYIPFENTLTATEYVALRNILMNTVTSKLNSLPTPTLPQGVKASSITTYPQIFPTRIHRTPANQEGTGLANVEVTYARIPNFQKKHAPVQVSIVGTNLWTDCNPYSMASEFVSIG